MASPTPPPSSRTRVRRAAARGCYDRSEIDAILDAGFICHVGFLLDGAPSVIPTLYARADDRLLLHGSSGSRMLRSLIAGEPACVTVTHTDGLVLARSAFHHSVNYRSVVVFGRAEQVTDPDEKLAALEAFLEQLVPGRWPEVRAPNSEELTRTAVVAIPLDEASAKVRTGGPIDDEDDYAIAVWAGVVPFAPRADVPVDDGRLQPGVRLPRYVSSWQPGG